MSNFCIQKFSLWIRLPLRYLCQGLCLPICQLSWMLRVRQICDHFLESYRFGVFCIFPVIVQSNVEIKRFKKLIKHKANMETIIVMITWYHKCIAEISSTITITRTTVVLRILADTKITDGFNNHNMGMGFNICNSLWN